MKSTYKSMILSIALALTLIFNHIDSLATTYECSYCDGGSGWSGNGGGTPPDCEDRISTRTLGTCAGPAQPGSTCKEDSKATKHAIYYSVDQDGICVAQCQALWFLCDMTCAGDPPDLRCMADCRAAFDSCIADCVQCIIDSEVYSDYQNGC